MGGRETRYPQSSDATQMPVENGMHGTLRHADITLTSEGQTGLLATPLTSTLRAAHDGCPVTHNHSHMSPPPTFQASDQR